jgi:hypothetical protein
MFPTDSTSVAGVREFRGVVTAVNDAAGIGPEWIAVCGGFLDALRLVTRSGTHAEDG